MYSFLYFSGNVFGAASGDCLTEAHWILFDPDLPSLYFAGGPILGGFLAQ